MLGASTICAGTWLNGCRIGTIPSITRGARRLILAGFSFGAFVALRLALARDAARLITVAPPVGRFDFSELHAPACPWLVVQGDADDVVDPNAVIAWVTRQNPAPELRVVPGVGHFFHGHLAELRDAVIETLRSG